MPIKREARNVAAEEIIDRDIQVRKSTMTVRFTDEERKELKAFLAGKGITFQEYCFNAIAEDLDWVQRVKSHEGNKKR